MTSTPRPVRWIAAALTAAAVIALLALWPRPSATIEELAGSTAASVSIAGVPGLLDVEIAATPAARARGLMGRENVPAGTGMIFAFETADDQSFWMKDTLVPLDIAWVRNGKITGITTMKPCPDGGDMCPSYLSPGRVDAAIEVSAGTFSAVQVGSPVRITNTTPMRR